MITRCILLLVFVAGLVVGCSTKPRHVSAADFQKQWEMRHAQTVHWSSYLGETNGNVYMLRKTMPLVGSKWKEEVLFTETNGLAPGFLEQMRDVSKLEHALHRTAAGASVFYVPGSSNAGFAASARFWRRSVS